MIAVWVTLVIIVVFDFLVMNLVILHIYLSCKGLTTFEMIMLMKEGDNKAKKKTTPRLDDPTNNNIFELGAAVRNPPVPLR